MIIHRGSLTLEKLKELASQHLQLKDNSDEYNPNNNPKAISIIEQADGNYIGKANKFGKVVEVRAGDPQTVLVSLITHS